MSYLLYKRDNMLVINNNFKLVKIDTGYLLVDISEKRYGKDKEILMLNSSGAHIYELLQEYSPSEVIDILFNEEDNSFSRDTIHENVYSIVDILVENGVFTGESPQIACTITIDKVGFGPIKSRLGAKRQPLVGVVEMTPKCNCNCPHCYVKGLSGDNWLTTEQYVEIAEILRQKGILNVTLTGGEPLSHPDFKHIYIEFKKRGFLIDIFSNALLIDEDMANFLEANPPRSIDVTLYGLSDEEYYRFTGVQNGFTKLCNALNLLKERDVFFTTKMILHKGNYNRLLDYNNFALQYNAPFRYNVIIGRGNNTIKDPNDIALSNEEILAIESQDPLRKAIFSMLANDCTCLPGDCNEQNWSQYPCGAGLDKVFIGYDGKMSPCMTLRNKGLNLFSLGYDAIWEHWGNMRKEAISKDFKCKSCEYLPICTPCTEEFEQENGDKNIPIESRCELAKMRWEKLLK